MPAKAAAGTVAVLKARLPEPLECGAQTPPLPTLARRNVRGDIGYPGPRQA